MHAHAIPAARGAPERRGYPRCRVNAPDVPSPPAEALPRAPGRKEGHRRDQNSPPPSLPPALHPLKEGRRGVPVRHPSQSSPLPREAWGGHPPRCRSASPPTRCRDLGEAREDRPVTAEMTSSPPLPAPFPNLKATVPTGPLLSGAPPDTHTRTCTHTRAHTHTPWGDRETWETNVPVPRDGLSSFHQFTFSPCPQERGEENPECCVRSVWFQVHA